MVLGFSFLPSRSEFLKSGHACSYTYIAFSNIEKCRIPLYTSLPCDDLATKSSSHNLILTRLVLRVCVLLFCATLVVVSVFSLIKSIGFDRCALILLNSCLALGRQRVTGDLWLSQTTMSSVSRSGASKCC